MSASITDSFATIAGYSPYLSAVITTPANGTTVQVGQCFAVTAKITCTCPAFTDSGQFSEWFIKPVYAVSFPGAVYVVATINISGSAVLNHGQSAQISLGNLDCNGQATATWTVCCAGKGSTTITVTPSGYAAFLASHDSENELFAGWNILDKLAAPVYANMIEPLPVPADHITSASVTVFQVPSPLRSDDTSSGASAPQARTWAMPADNKVTTAFVQPQQVLAGQPVKIMANVANKGDLPGSYTATLTINNQIEATKKLTVPGRAAIPIEFTVVRDKPGNYEADVNGQKVYFTVSGPAAGNPVDARLIVIVALAALILTAVIILIRYLATR